MSSRLSFPRNKKMLLVAVVVAISLISALATFASGEVTKVEAEKFSIGSNDGSPYNDTTASAGKALLIWNTATAQYQLNTPQATQVIVSAKGDVCDGSPHMVVKVDGNTVISTDVPNTAGWKEYSANKALSAGMHTFKISFTNNYKTSSCNRNLRVDYMRLLDNQSAPSPSPSAPAVAVASPSPSLTPTPTSTGTTSGTIIKAAGLESNNFNEFNSTNALEGTLTTTTERVYDGKYSAKATYDGGGNNGYTRGIFTPTWPNGSDVWYSGAFFLPSGFKDSMRNQVDFMRWDDYPGDSQGGFVIYNFDKKGRIILQKRTGGSASTIVGPFDIPENRWFHIEVHQKLSNGGDALTEVYLDGVKIGSSTAPNSYGTTITRLRYGIVAIGAGSQNVPLTLWFDKAIISNGRVGP